VLSFKYITKSRNKLNTLQNVKLDITKVKTKKKLLNYLMTRFSKIFQFWPQHLLSSYFDPKFLGNMIYEIDIVHLVASYKHNSIIIIPDYNTKSKNKLIKTKRNPLEETTVTKVSTLRTCSISQLCHLFDILPIPNFPHENPL